MSSFSFDTEDDLKNYLDHVEKEYKFSCFDQKDPEGCHLLGSYFSYIKDNYTLARKIFKKNCEENDHPESCVFYAGLLSRGYGGELNVPESCKISEKACYLGYKESCYISGHCNNTYMNENGLESNTRQKLLKNTVRLFHRGCDIDEVKSCYLMSIFYKTGSHGVTPDAAKQLKYAIKSCELGYSVACRDVAKMYKNGIGTTKDLHQAKVYLKKFHDLKLTDTTQPVGVPFASLDS